MSAMPIRLAPQAAIDKARTSNDGFEPRFVQDLRQILDDREVDIVTVAAPNHWHSLRRSGRCRRGKDVYVEKPISHNLLEGRRVVQVAAKTKRVCSMDRRCDRIPRSSKALAFVRGGALGKMLVSRDCVTSRAPASARFTSRRLRHRRWITTSGAARRRWRR